MSTLEDIRIKLKKEEHPFHLVNPSPWPLITSCFAFTMLVGTVYYFHGGSALVQVYGLIGLLFSMGFWWRDIIREATFEGCHTLEVQKGLAYGMVLFIVSEVMFFFSFFWAFFHSSVAPAVQIGGVWPPEGIDVLDPWGVPLLNTVILLSSGVSVTLAHKAILLGKRNKQFFESLVLTVALGIFFTGLQVFEYKSANFTISDGIYGSTFYLATGFHGFHVLIGTTFLIVCAIRAYNYHFTPTHHFGFIACVWYWHFVDVVWIFLFITIYWWGS